jgi:hypothetical protein
MNYSLETIGMPSFADDDNKFSRERIPDAIEVAEDKARKVREGMDWYDKYHDRNKGSASAPSRGTLSRISGAALGKVTGADENSIQKQWTEASNQGGIMLPIMVAEAMTRWNYVIGCSDACVLYCSYPSPIDCLSLLRQC